MRFRSGYAVTSAGIAHSLGNRVDTALGALFRGERGLARVQVFPQRLAKPHWVTAGCTALGADDPWELSPLGAADPYPTRQRWLAAQAQSAILADSRAACERWGAGRVAVLLGTSTGSIEASERAFLELTRRGTLPEAYSFDAHHAFSALAREVAFEIGAAGPCYVISTACSSSAKALAAAGRLLNTGFADAVLVAGVDSLCLTTLLGFGALGVLAPDGAEPFAAVPKGMSVAEGAAFLLLERSTQGDVFLIAAGESSDAYQMTHPHPEGEGAERAMRQALRAADLDPSDVAYVNAHGTGTRVNDAAEALALGRVFKHQPCVSSTKGATGHLLGACGATEALICVEAIRRGLAPGNGPWALSPDLPFEVPQQATPKNIPFALSNAFAFGGSNASLLFASRSGQARLTSNAADADVIALELLQAVRWPADDREPEAGALPDAGTLLSERARGRASPLTRLFAELLQQLSARDEKLRRCPQIFASAYGEMDTTLKLLELQTRSGESSPLRFQVSVHNAAQGLLSIATGHQGFATSLAAGSDTFAMALVEAAAFLGDSGEADVLVLLADEAAAAPLCREHFAPLAVGFQLRAVRRPTGAQHLLSLPRRSAPPHAVLLQPPAPAAALRANPIADALQLVWAFNNNAQGTLQLGAAPSRTRDDAWSVTYGIDV